MDSIGDGHKDSPWDDVVAVDDGVWQLIWVELFLQENPLNESNLQFSIIYNMTLNGFNHLPGDEYIEPSYIRNGVSSTAKILF